MSQANRCNVFGMYCYLLLGGLIEHNSPVNKWALTLGLQRAVNFNLLNLCLLGHISLCKWLTTLSCSYYLILWWRLKNTNKPEWLGSMESPDAEPLIREIWDWEQGPMSPGASRWLANNRWVASVLGKAEHYGVKNINMEADGLGSNSTTY